MNMLKKSEMNLLKKSDQFDVRLNIENQYHLNLILKYLEEWYVSGALKYVHCSGIEIGTNKDYSSYQKEHVHIALVLCNRTSKNSIIKKLIWNRYKNLGYYIEPRDKSLPISGWISYHSKRETKLDPESGLILQMGTPPQDSQDYRKRANSEISTDQEEAIEAPLKMSKYAQWKRKLFLIKMNKMDLLDQEFPGFQYSTMGKNMIIKEGKQNQLKPLEGDLENVIIYGPTGTGKSSSISFLYPNCYKKQKGTQYWDFYDIEDPDHSVVWIDEFSKETLKTFVGKLDGGFEFLKELADRYPVAVDGKWCGTFKIRPKKIIITMNEHPTSLLPDRAITINKDALFRKFKIYHVNDWLMLNNLRLKENGKGVERIHLSICEEIDYSSDTTVVIKYSSSEDENGNIESSRIIESRSRKNRTRDQGVQTEPAWIIPELLFNDGEIEQLFRHYEK